MERKPSWKEGQKLTSTEKASLSVTNVMTQIQEMFDAQKNSPNK